MRRLVFAAAAAALALPALPAAAQDIELAARAGGVALPAAYHERIRQSPDFFELKRGWRNLAPPSSALLPPGAPSPWIVLPPRGELRMAVVMALFADSGEPPYPASLTQRLLFGDNPLGSLTDFYADASGGRVNLTGQVSSWVRTGITRAEAVGSSYGLGRDGRAAEFFMDALARVDGEIDFALYDNDGPDGIPNSGDDDGFVDVAVFQFAEVAASCGGPGIWPHRSTLTGWLGAPYHTRARGPDGRPIFVDDYIVQSAVDCDGEPQSISTIAHETGHAFGLLDYYHAVNGILPSQRRWVLGCWTLMAAGGWGCGDGSTFGKTAFPSRMGAFERWLLGWMRRVQHTGWQREHLLQPAAAGGDALAVDLGRIGEYLLMEFRPNTGWDAGLPAGGVLVYHVDHTRPHYPCATCPPEYAVALVEADNDGALLRTHEQGGNRGVAGDAFTGTRTVTDADFPLLRRNDRRRSHLRLDFVVSADVARVRVSILPVVERARLLAPFFAGAGLAPQEAEAYDFFGNGNGRYDLGDLRRFLREDAAE